MYVDEAAKACEFFLKKTKSSLINVGSPIEMSIKDYAHIVKNLIDPSVKIEFNKDIKLDGIKKKNWIHP